MINAAVLSVDSCITFGQQNPKPIDYYRDGPLTVSNIVNSLEKQSPNHHPVKIAKSGVFSTISYKTHRLVCWMAKTSNMIYKPALDAKLCFLAMAHHPTWVIARRWH